MEKVAEKTPSPKAARSAASDGLAPPSKKSRTAELEPWQRLQQLQVDKATAVEQEDFARAKELQVQVISLEDALRHGGGPASPTAGPVRQTESKLTRSGTLTSKKQAGDNNAAAADDDDAADDANAAAPTPLWLPDPVDDDDAAQLPDDEDSTLPFEASSCSEDQSDEEPPPQAELQQMPVLPAS